MAYITNRELSQSLIFDTRREDISLDEIREIEQSDVPKEIEQATPALVTNARQYAKKRKAKPDWHTKNKSFLNLYNDLYKLGIQNNKFFLALYDQDLVGIDPYAGKLPLDLQAKIALECVINPWYYLRELCRIPEDGAEIKIGGGIQYQIDRNNVASWYLFLNGIDAYQSKPRQTGKTQDEIAKLLYSYLFGTLSANILLFNKSMSDAKKNLYRMKCQRDMLPAYLQMRAVITEKGTLDKGQDNITMMRNPITGNTVEVMPTAGSKDSAMRLGRGATAALQYYDEFDFTPYNIEIINAASFAYKRAAENAKKNHALYGRLFSSTAGDLDSRDGKAAAQYIDTFTVWNDHYFDKPINELKKIMNGDKRTPIMYVEHTWQQLRKSVQWYEESCALVSFNETVIMREINLQRIHGSSLSPFKRSDLMYLTSHKKEPIRSEDMTGELCNVYFYENMIRSYPYILAVDPSEGLGRDNHAFTVINPYTQHPVAEFKSQYLSQPELFKVIKKFMDKYCPKAMVVIESNRGRELINKFLESYYRPNLYFDIDKLTTSNRVTETTNEYGAHVRSAMERRAYGVATTATSRNEMYRLLETFVVERKDCLYTQFLVQDINSLELHHNKLAAVGEDNHDDNIMSYIIGLYVYYNATNLEQYGIVRGASAPEDIRAMPEEEKASKIKQMLSALPDEIKGLFGGFLNEKDPVEEDRKYYEQIGRLMNPESLEQEEIPLDPEQAFGSGSVDGIDQFIFESNFRDTEVHTEDWL